MLPTRARCLIALLRSASPALAARAVAGDGLGDEVGAELALRLELVVALTAEPEVGRCVVSSVCAGLDVMNFEPRDFCAAVSARANVAAAVLVALADGAHVGVGHTAAARTGRGTGLAIVARTPRWRGGWQCVGGQGRRRANAAVGHATGQCRRRAGAAAGSASGSRPAPRWRGGTEVARSTSVGLTDAMGLAGTAAPSPRRSGHREEVVEASLGASVAPSFTLAPARPTTSPTKVSVRAGSGCCR